jgi:pyruvate/2-oxoglutarate dehydrogenase complex dihydrolipoamide acyltransferase (E2) component
MSTEVLIPEDLWEEDEEAVITSWLVSDGNVVEQGDVIAEIMVQKIQYELEAPVSGTLQIIKEMEEIVAKGDKVATIA